MVKPGIVSEWTSPNEERQFRNIKLKPMQIAILNCNLVNSVLVNLPTGFGKSLLFQYPASKLTDKCVVVFVPLKALLWDCLKQADIFDVSASELTPEAVRKYYKTKQLCQLYFLTPERLFCNVNVSSFLEYLHSEGKIQMMVIDEVHCISEWGSDFRPDYSKICNITKMFEGIRVLGMSATIPPEARDDLTYRLKIPLCYYFQSSSNRPNLKYEVLTTKQNDICSDICKYLGEKELSEAPGIIYCQTIKSAQALYQKLLKTTLSVCMFHSKISEKQREQTFKKFMDEEIKIVVATICFGMGVNKKNIRFVINVGVSLSGQNYYQESGRAGRDGLTAYCLLLTFNGDTNPLQFLIQKSSSNKKLKYRKFYKLKQIKDYTTAKECRKKHLFDILGEQFTPEQCKKSCDFCLSGKLQEFKQIDFTQKGLQIMNQLTISKVQLTKKQLADILKGKSMTSNLKTKVDRVKKLVGLLKEQTMDVVEALIQRMMEMQLLISKVTFIGPYKSRVERLVPCSRTVVKKVTSIVVKFTKIIQNKSVNLNVTKPSATFKINKFDKYLKQKGSFDLEPATIKKQASIDSLPTSVEKLNDDQKSQFQDWQLKEIKMASKNDNYMRFFNDVFGSMDEETEPRKSEPIEDFSMLYRPEDLCQEVFDWCDNEFEVAALQKKEFSTESFDGLIAKEYKDEELEKSMQEPPTTENFPKAKTINLISSEDQSIDSQFLQMVRLAKEREEKRKKLTVVRNQLKSKDVDFL